MPRVRERGDPRPDDVARILVDPDRRLEGEHGVAVEGGSLDCEEVVDAVEGLHEARARCGHDVMVAPAPGGLTAMLQRPQRPARDPAERCGDARRSRGQFVVVWTSRIAFPEGSRRPASIPYGRSDGSSVNSTPRPLSSSYVAGQSSVEKNGPPAAPFAMTSRTASAVSGSNTGGPGMA